MSKLPILMYHAVSLIESEALTISTEKLEEQFGYLADKGYKTYHFKELLEYAKLPSKKTLLLLLMMGM